MWSTLLLLAISNLLGSTFAASSEPACGQIINAPDGKSDFQIRPGIRNLGTLTYLPCPRPGNLQSQPRLRVPHERALQRSRCQQVSRLLERHAQVPDFRVIPQEPSLGVPATRRRLVPWHVSAAGCCRCRQVRKPVRIRSGPAAPSDGCARLSSVPRGRGSGRIHLCQSLRHCVCIC